MKEVRNANGSIRNQMTQSQVRELFEYRDGQLFWKSRPANNVDIAKPAGCLDTKGYTRIRYKNKDYLRHVLVWNYHYDKITDNNFVMDHIIGIDHGGTDRIENLRLTTQTKNIENRVAFNKLGIKNIRYFTKCKKKPWFVYMKNHNISEYFETLSEAILYRNQIYIELGLEPAKDNPKPEYLEEYNRAYNLN